MRTFTTYIVGVFIMALILTPLVGCSTGAFLPGPIPTSPSSPFYDRMVDFKSSLASDPNIGHLKESHDGNHGNYLGYGSHRINRSYQENYTLDGQFKGRSFSLHHLQIEAIRYHEPVWIPVKLSGDGNHWAFIEIKPGYVEKSIRHNSSLSMSVSSVFEAKISGEGFSAWLRKNLLRQQEVTIDIASMDQAYFVRSDEAGMIRRLFQDSAVQENLDLLKKNGLLPLEIAKGEIRIKKTRLTDPADTTKYLDALNNIGMAVEKISYMERPDGCP